MNNEPTEFQPWPKMARLSRECIITEKLDGTNACVNIVPTRELRDSSLAVAQIEHTLIEGCVTIFAGSRTRWIQPGNDNYGFAAWVKANSEELAKLGPGRHFGEFWGAGIQRRYGLTEKRFSLFNASRWGADPVDAPGGPGVFEIVENGAANRRGPSCCHVVPVLYRGEFHSDAIADALGILRISGSVAAPGFRQPEGIIVYHVAGKVAFKKTFDDSPKNS